MALILDVLEVYDPDILTPPKKPVATPLLNVQTVTGVWPKEIPWRIVTKTNTRVMVGAGPVSKRVVLFLLIR